MNRDHVLAVVPHYLAMFLVIAGVLAATDAFFGGLGFWIELAIVIVVASLYRPVVRHLRIAPEPWQ
ncbi:hypothetical protein [Haloprofundus salinisoli]|uniref:hypothetical protein n=1 Tax=Haloprofundus salinisoli TaxID=2876193 RepID=UPI001CC91241|nr:hypothetical protein [Haloprofundus salinisoli]